MSYFYSCKRTTKMKTQDFWKTHVFKINQTKLFKAGMVEIHVKRIHDGWLIKSNNTTVQSELTVIDDIEDFADNDEVIHFYSKNSNELVLSPALPNKAVVFRNSTNIKISSEQSANLFFLIPLSIQFYSSEIKDENLIAEVPLKRLTDTWFGEIDNGEAAFSIGSNYFRLFNEIESSDWQAISSVEIINNTSETLDLQRLILRVEDFNLYLNNNQLYTHHAVIEFKGQEHAASVNLDTRIETHGKKPHLIAKARSANSSNLLRRSFYFLKNIYQN